MVNIVLRFPGGRFHATPWGNHVNEGLVEWPPSPWRIARALLATGFSKLGWREPPSQAQELIEGLASALPDYRLPVALASHTRHWVPTNSRSPEKKTKLFDAFAHVGRNAEIAVMWPIELSEGARNLLGDLVPKLSYLGRSESVVEARLVAEGDLPHGMVASATEVNQPGLEPVALLAPMTAAAYAAWLAEAIQTAAKREGRRRNAKASPFPLDSFAAVLVDTAFLQEHGWTQPPGSRRVHYYRPPLATSPRQLVTSGLRVVAADTALLALASDTRRGEILPLLARALPQAELLHMGLVSHADRFTCPELTGLDSTGIRLEGHRHATFLPLNLDRDRPGRIDHFLVHAPMGFGANAQRALRIIRRTYAKGAGDPLFVTLVGLGALRDFVHLGDRPVVELTQAQTWTSKTPFVPPRHIKPRRHTLEDQVQAELATRGLPPANRIDVLVRDEVVARGFQRFVRERRDPRRRPPAPCFFGLRIELERPVRGPVSLGYASHFGLGLFAPASDL